MKTTFIIILFAAQLLVTDAGSEKGVWAAPPPWAATTLVSWRRSPGIHDVTTGPRLAMSKILGRGARIYRLLTVG